VEEEGILEKSYKNGRLMRIKQAGI